jgi:hypothetical protein
MNYEIRAPNHLIKWRRGVVSNCYSTKGKAKKSQESKVTHAYRTVLSGKEFNKK